MIIPHADGSNLFNTRDAITPPLQPDKLSRFPSYTLGIASLLGGDDAISAIAAVHIHGNRRWLGWYNTPGSFQIINRLHSLTKSASFHNLSPAHLSSNVHVDPTTLFRSDGHKGPRFRSAHSGTVIEETGYLAVAFMRECAAWNGKVVPEMRIQPIAITVANLGEVPVSELCNAPSTAFALPFASIPISFSIGACVLCAVFRDWYASSLIVIGIIAGGISCLVLGSADLVFTHPKPAAGSLAGDGILGTDKDMVVLKGTEGAVNSITCGRFFLRFSNEHHYNLIRSCSILFFIQSTTQLLFIPRASLFGQLMFFATLGVSALYNACLSSDKEGIHRKLLFERVLQKAKLTKYMISSRAAAAVFMLLVLQPQDPAVLLNELLPNDTKVWRQWKAMILEELRHRDGRPFLSKRNVRNLNGFTKQEQGRLQLLYDDARAADIAYKDYLRVES